MRTDYSLIEKWKLSSHHPPCHICEFIGNDDPDVNKERAKCWEAWSKTEFTLAIFSGVILFQLTPRNFVPKINFTSERNNAKSHLTGRSYHKQPAAASILAAAAIKNNKFRASLHA